MPVSGALPGHIHRPGLRRLARLVVLRAVLRDVRRIRRLLGGIDSSLLVLFFPSVFQSYLSAECYESFRVEEVLSEQDSA